jgi:hypothetical protein
VALLAALLAGCGGATGSKPAAKPAAKLNPADPVFPIGRISETTSHQIAKLDDVASKLAGRPTIVNCWSERDWKRFQIWLSHQDPSAVEDSGWTWFPTRLPAVPHIELTPNQCQVLAQAIARSANQPLFTAFAVTLLAHESAHASGIHAENQAECRGIETEPKAAALLGLPRALGKRLQRIYRGTSYLSDTPEYNTPACPAGLPGLLVPDTLGTADDLRPLRAVGAAVAKSLGGWKNIGGELAGGPLSPCSPIASRTFERARFTETFDGPNDQSVFFASRRLKTRGEFATAMRRYPNLERCEIRFRNNLNRLSGTPGTYTRSKPPNALLHISPRVHAFRMVLTNGHEKSNWDRFDIFYPGHLGHTDIRFTVPVGTPIAQEVRTVRAALHFLPAGG